MESTDNFQSSKDLVPTRINGLTTVINSFPFQTTPSGNLKVKPKQVVFETEKFSVVVADPGKTNVSVEGFMASENQKIVDFCSNRARALELPKDVKETRNKDVKETRDTKKQEPERINPIKTTSTSLSHAKYTPSSVPQNPFTYGERGTRERRELTLKEMGFSPMEQVNWDTIKLPAKNNLLDMLQNKIVQKLNTDFTVKIGSKEFKCHKLVLQSYSNYFSALNETENRVEIPESKVSSKAFHLIYSWMTEVPSNCWQLLQRGNILDVFSAAQYLQIKDLEEQCLAFVDSEDLFNEDTAFLLYSDAKKKKNVSVMELMVPRIQRFFLTLVSSKDWLELSMEEVIVFLHSNYICVHSEMEIFMAGIRWLMFNFEERKSHVNRIMECVRFGNMTPLQLVEIRRNQNSPEIMEVVRESGVQKMIEDGLSYSVFKDQYKHDAAAYKKLISTLRLEEPEPRNWAGQDQNYKSYKDFLDVLDSFRTAGTEDIFEWSAGSEDFIMDL